MAWVRAAMVAALSFLSTALLAQDVTLTSPDGQVELSGTLLGFDGEFYRIETVYGELTVDGSGVRCEGPACPNLQDFVAEVSLSGSRMLTGEGEFKRMAGWIYVYDDISKPPLDQFSVNLDAVTATATNLPENAVVMPPAKADFYETLIDAFAERAAAGIADI